MTKRVIDIEVLGVPYKIIFSEDALAEIAAEYDMDPALLRGLHVGVDREIYISPPDDPRRLAETLLHELLHAIGSITGHIKLSVSRESNEAFVDALATALVTVLRNPEIYLLLGLSLGVLKREGGDDRALSVEEIFREVDKRIEKVVEADNSSAECATCYRARNEGKTKTNKAIKRGA